MASIVKGTLPTRLSEREGEIALRFWKAGLDTMEIAMHMHVTEERVYNSLAALRAKARVREGVGKGGEGTG